MLRVGACEALAGCMCWTSGSTIGDGTAVENVMSVEIETRNSESIMLLFIASSTQEHLNVLKITRV